MTLKELLASYDNTNFGDNEPSDEIGLMVDNNRSRVFRLMKMRQMQEQLQLLQLTELILELPQESEEEKEKRRQEFWKSNPNHVLHLTSVTAMAENMAYKNHGTVELSYTASVLSEAARLSGKSISLDLGEKNEAKKKNLDPSKAQERWISTYKNDRDARRWIQDMKLAYKKHGLSDKAIKCLIAKNALESSYGKIAQGRFNFGNLTVGNNYKGMYYMGHDNDANGNRIKNIFRAYNSIEDYVADELDFLKRIYHYESDEDIDKFLSKLVDGEKKYATSKHYKSSVKQVYHFLTNKYGM